MGALCTSAKHLGVPTEEDETGRGRSGSLEKTLAPSSSSRYSTGNVDLHYAYMSRRGYYPKTPNKRNQDAFVIKTQFCGFEDRVLYAVFDGHGPVGDQCACFCRDELPGNLEKELNALTIDDAMTSSEDIKKCLTTAFVNTNKQLRKDRDIDDDQSGTTCILALILGKALFVANCGDSRAIMASGTDSLTSVPLSHDQTPYRKDERDRVMRAGARIMNMGQMEGMVPRQSPDSWGDIKIGENPDEDHDPPRVWHKTEPHPGAAFTRSLGDAEAEKLGVFAEPEIHVRELEQKDQFLCVMSDGVTEFLTNETICKMVKKHPDPLPACKQLVEESYQAWLDMDYRTDDITVICIYLGDVSAGDGEEDAPKAHTPHERKSLRRRGSLQISETGHFTDIIPSS